MTAATARRVVQFMPRLTHQSSAQLHDHGHATVELQSGLVLLSARRYRLPPVSTLTAPPILMQVCVPSTLTKPEP